MVPNNKHTLRVIVVVGDEPTLFWVLGCVGSGQKRCAVCKETGAHVDFAVLTVLVGERDHLLVGLRRGAADGDRGQEGELLEHGSEGEGCVCGSCVAYMLYMLQISWSWMGRIDTCGK
jgi:hypothetical protein